MQVIESRVLPSKGAKIAGILLFIAAGAWLFSLGISVYSLRMSAEYPGQITFIGGSKTGSSIYYQIIVDNVPIEGNCWVVLTGRHKQGEQVRIRYDESRNLSYVEDLIVPNSVLFFTSSVALWVICMYSIIKTIGEWNEKKRQ